MNYPEKQHFVPEFYLRGFTVNGRDEDYLYVLAAR